MPGQNPWLVRLAAALALLAGLSSSAHAQDAYSWSRYHAEPPLSGILPEPLSPPPSPTESGALGERPTRDLVDNLDGSYSYEEAGFRARVDGEGRVTLADKSSVQGHIFLSPLFIAAYGTFDATDLIMRWLGEDPYQYQKMSFLERTFEERSRMRARHARKTMDRALRELPDYLQRIWEYEAWPVELRKRVFFALWDECAEDGNSLVASGGARARAIIVGFVRSNLGPDSPGAYQPAELARLNQMRTSRARFAPYDAAPDAPALIAVSAAETPAD